MSLKDTKIIIKEDGGSSSTLKKKKKKEEEKAVAIIKSDTPSAASNTGTNASRLREVARESVTEGVAKRDSAQTGNRTPSYSESRQPTPTTTSWSPSLKRDALAAPDYSSPTAAWRNPETFQAIPWSDYEGLNKYDRKAYLKAYAENSQKEKAQRDAVAQAEAQRLNQEKSDKMLADHFYSRMLKGEQIDVSNFDAKTLQNLQQRAYEDYSNGNLSMEKYLLMPIHKFESLDNGQAKVYNGNIDNPTQPLMQTSGFDRYRTELYSIPPKPIKFGKIDSIPKIHLTKTQEEYKNQQALITKALGKVKNGIDTYMYSSYYSKDFKNSVGDAFPKILQAFENGSNPETFANDLKVRIEIKENFNFAGRKLLMEGASFIPIAGSIAGLVDYMSEEDNSWSGLLESLGAFLLEDDVVKLGDKIGIAGISDALKFAQSIDTLKTAYEMGNIAFNSGDDYVGTEIWVLVQDGDYGYYTYHAFVDKDMKFKELYSSYTRNIKFVKGEMFQILVK